MHKIGDRVYKFKNYQNAPLELIEGEIKQILNGGKFYVILWWGKGGEWTDTEQESVVYLSIKNAAIAYFTKLTAKHIEELRHFKQVWQHAEKDMSELKKFFKNADAEWKKFFKDVDNGFQKFFEDVHV